MQTVCDQKFYGMLTEDTRKHFGPLLTMPAHEKRLGYQLFWGGLAVSGLMLLAIHALGL